MSYLLNVVIRCVKVYMFFMAKYKNRLSCNLLLVRRRLCALSTHVYYNYRPSYQCRLYDIAEGRHFQTIVIKISLPEHHLCVLLVYVPFFVFWSEFLKQDFLARLCLRIFLVLLLHLIPRITSPWRLAHASMIVNSKELACALVGRLLIIKTLRKVIMDEGQ